jgi:hypothetical protein
MRVLLHKYRLQVSSVNQNVSRIEYYNLVQVKSDQFHFMRENISFYLLNGNELHGLSF